MSNSISSLSPQSRISNIKFMRHTSRSFVVGVDGGATKTRAVILPADEGVQTGDKQLGEGIAGASNPLRSGILQAAAEVRRAIELACIAARIERAEIVAAEIGLAGVRKIEVRARMREALINLNIVPYHVTTDSDVALYGATEGKSGLVVIAGTGSVCCGQDGRGRRVDAGGWGPLAGDEGSAAWIARQALQRVAHAEDGRGGATTLTKVVREYFGVTAIEDLGTIIYGKEMTHTRIAGLARFVIEAARGGDAIAKEILENAGRELGRIAATVARKLKLEETELRVAYVGGVFAAGDLVLDSMRAELAPLAEKINLAPPRLPPAVAAAHLARKLLVENLALAG